MQKDLAQKVAGKIGISEIAVKIHRGNLMKKMRAKSLAELVRMAEVCARRACHAQVMENVG